MNHGVPLTSSARLQQGVLLIEVLVAIVICAFGLLGFAGMQARSTSAEFESYQRSQALVLIEDMVNRINANRANAGAYVSANLLGAGSVTSCASLSGADLDLCEWSNLIRGSAETRSGTLNVGAMISARACIKRVTNTTDGYLISVAWEGIISTGAPTDTCGQGDAAFPTDTLRRVVSSTVCVGQLVGGETAPAIPRC